MINRAWHNARVICSHAQLPAHVASVYLGRRIFSIEQRPCNIVFFCIAFSCTVYPFCIFNIYDLRLRRDFTEKKTQLNKWLQLEPLPDDSFRNAMLIVLVLDIVAAFIWDRLMLLFFAPKILMASFEDTTWKDAINYLRVMSICAVVIYFLATVNLTAFFFARARFAPGQTDLRTISSLLQLCFFHVHIFLQYEPRVSGDMSVTFACYSAS